MVKQDGNLRAMRDNELYRMARLKWPSVTLKTRLMQVDRMVQYVDIADSLNYIAMENKAGIVAWLWRIIGKTLRVPSLEQRGKKYPPCDLADFSKETIELHRYHGYHEYDGLIAMGYGPESDILAVIMEPNG